MTTEPTQYIGPTADDVREFYRSLYGLIPHEQAAHLTGIWLQGQMEAAAQRTNVSPWRKMLDASVAEAQRIKEVRGDG